ncbi:MAG: hypothetical protein DMF93_11250 [Acidobacteria bacterium]|nr:MAG: hypothetical protein DMF93_11250 [Acidobacteriota bacterium]
MFRPTRSDEDFRAEVDAHLQLEIERLQEEGLSADEARAAARRAFGNVTLVGERFYESRRWVWRDHLWQDAVVNEATARLLWPNEDALGQHVKLSPTAASWATIVGVVADARTESLTDPRVPLVFSSLYQRRSKHLAIFLRGYMDPAAAPDAVRELVQAIDPTLPVFGARMLKETVSASLAERRFSMELVGAFALTALLLAGLGIYGVVSFMVGDRTREIGLRLALGAQKRTILRTILYQGLKLTVAGAIVGLACALIVSRLMAGVLFGVRPTDPATFVGVAALLIAVGVVACYIPARRAIQMDPMIALRHE